MNQKYLGKEGAQEPLTKKGAPGQRGRAGDHCGEEERDGEELLLTEKRSPRKEREATKERGVEEEGAAVVEESAVEELRVEGEHGAVEERGEE